jgi:hypothetical protein
VNYQLITPIHDPSPHERPIHLFQAQEFLSPSLEVLRLTDIRESNLADLCRKYAQDSKQGSAKDFILGTATALRLRRFELCVRMEYWVNQEKRVIELAEATREFMPVMTEAMKSLGTRMLSGVSEASSNRSYCMSQGLRHRSRIGKTLTRAFGGRPSF